ncbi:IS982 family transposase [Nonomuraea sp. NPDC049637]|uniref:IS982 family transposase n=1 Tax=Nonomuraea sp. NPDC049637 TaxID=3154356 RepID=UPI003418D118
MAAEGRHPPTLSDAELVTLAVLSALLGFTSERRWPRHARTELSAMFSHLPGQPGYNRRLRNACGLVRHVIRILAADTSLWSDDVWVADSTPIKCGRSRGTTARRSALAGWAEYDYCASHSRYFWGLRLHLLCTLGGLPVLHALSGAEADEREVLLGMRQAAPDVLTAHPRQTIIADRHHYGRVFEAELTERELHLLCPARQSEPERPGAALFKPLRQTIESIKQTRKSQLDLERHGGRIHAGVIIRVLTRILALTSVVRHNDKTGQPLKRSLALDT